MKPATLGVDNTVPGLGELRLMLLPDDLPRDQEIVCSSSDSCADHSHVNVPAVDLTAE